jgi:hypothetical protein
VSLEDVLELAAEVVALALHLLQAPLETGKVQLTVPGRGQSGEEQLPVRGGGPPVDAPCVLLEANSSTQPIAHGLPADLRCRPSGWL